MLVTLLDEWSDHLTEQEDRVVGADFDQLEHVESVVVEMLAAHLVLNAVIYGGSVDRADQDGEEEALYEGVKNLADEEQGT